MPAYIVPSDITIRDRDAFEPYRTHATAAIAAFGGRFLVRAGAVDVLEGGRDPVPLVTIELPRMATAERWYASPEHGRALALRDRAMERNLVLVEGVGDGTA